MRKLQLDLGELEMAFGDASWESSYFLDSNWPGDPDSGRDELGTFLFRRIRKAGKDARFDELKTSFPRFLLTWTLQGLWVTLTLAAALAAITTTSRK